MKPKIIHIIAILCTAFFFSSCEDWGLLEERPKRIDATTFMSNEEEVQSVINSMYSQIRRDPGFGRYLSVLPEALADYSYGRGNYATSYSTGLTTGGAGFSKDTWAVLYRVIRFGNEILNEIDRAPLTEDQYNRLAGEVRFLRAFSYSFLVKYYGAVPFFNEKNMDDFNKPRTPEEDIWKFIVDEASAAVEMLPEVPEKYGRPTKYAASLLKAEACLYLERWEEAEEAARYVVQSGKFSLVELSVADDFEKVYSHTANGTSEEIFYIKYNRDLGSSFTWMFFCTPNPIYNTGALGIYTDYVNNNFIANWDENDFRYQYSLYRQTANGTLNGLTRTGMICLKYRDREAAGANMAIDFPVYRYADALLYYAEAICRNQGQPSATAMEMINIVHRRAYGLAPTVPHVSDYKLADYNTFDKFMDLLLQERGYETIFEGKRYCDLKRCGKLAEYAMKAGKIESVSEVGDAAYWWPIPTDEFNYNTALDPTKDQNPGY